MRRSGSAGWCKRLLMPRKPAEFSFEGTKLRGPEDLISDLFKQCDGHSGWDGLPILVVRSSLEKDLLGILTPFDLL